MILNYGEFLNEKEWIVTDATILNNRRAFYGEAFTQFLNEDELSVSSNMINEGLFDTFTFDRIESLNENELYEALVLEWSLIDKIKDTAVKIKNKVKDGAAAAMTKTQELVKSIGGKIGGILKKIVGGIKEAFNKLVSMTKAAGGKVKAKLTEVFTKELEKTKKENDEQVKKENIKSLARDVGNAKKVSAHSIKWATGDLPKVAAKATQKVADEEVPGTGEIKETPKESRSYRNFTTMLESSLYEAMTEMMKKGELPLDKVEEEVELMEKELNKMDNLDALLEGGKDGQQMAKIPFLSRIAAMVNKIPPFSVLKKVKEDAAAIAGGVLNGLSYFATKAMGAPGPYKFVFLATFIGLAFEVFLGKKPIMITTQALVAVTFPPAFPLVEPIFSFAYILAAIVVLEGLVGSVLDVKDDWKQAKADVMKSKVDITKKNLEKEKE
jgi:hypothetical protein